MPRQFMLRLGDGTLLAVDQEGLRAWLVDDKARVQRAGSRRWQPLKDVIAEESAAAVAPRPKPVPAPPILEPIAAAPPPPPAAEEDIPIPLAPLDLGEIARSAAPVPLAEATAPPPRKRKLDDDVAITLKPVDLSEVARSAFTAKPDDRMPTIPLKPLEQEEVPEAFLAELDLIEEGTAAKREPFAKIMLDAVVAGVAGADRLVRRLRASRTWRLTGEQAARQRARLFAAVGPWRKRGALAAGAIAVLVVAASTSSIWMPPLARLVSGRPTRDAGPVPAAPIPEQTGPPIPKEVQAAMAQLPHLAPDTIQLVMSTADFAAPEPPEVFRRAYTAANRGASTLTAEETQELRTLKSAVLGALRPLERDRVRAYERMGAGRDLLAGEDGRVLALFARGVRALPAPRRERLQALYGKAIGAALARSAPRAAR